MTIYLACDHRGFELKEKIKTWLGQWGYQFEDFGAFAYNAEDDYPDFMKLVAEKVSQNPHDKGILLGGTGQGEAMIANRYRGVRAAVFYGEPLEIVSLSRQHNDANVLSLGVAPGLTIQEGKPMDENLVKEAIKLWLDTPFSAEPRHTRRIAKIDYE